MLSCVICTIIMCLLGISRYAGSVVDLPEEPAVINYCRWSSTFTDFDSCIASLALSVSFRT